MANIKQYRSNAKIPGLPDTTNITDPQLRLFLDRLKLVVTNLTVTVDGLAKYNNVDNIVRDLTNSQYFNSIIDQKVTDISTGIVKSEVKKSNNKKNKIVELDAIEIDPVEMTLNVFNEETASGTAEVYYVPHDTSPMYKGVTWSVSDDTVATIDQNGNVTALAVGKCTITATSNYDDDITAEAFLEVVYADTITVTATYQWCSQNSNVVCFTEIQEPVDGNCIWGATENTVTLLPDKTEEESKEKSALAIISNADVRTYIIPAGYGSEFPPEDQPEYAGKMYFRDPASDYQDGYKLKTVAQFVTADRNPEYGDVEIVWSTQTFYAGNEYGVEVYSKAKPEGESWTDADYIEFDQDKVLISKDGIFGGNYVFLAAREAGDIPDVEGAVLWSLVSACDAEGNSETSHEGYGYMKWTGEKTVLPDLPGEVDEYQTYTTYYEYVTFDGKFTAWCTADYRQQNGRVAAYPGKPYWGKDEYGFYAILPPNHSVQGYHRRSLGFSSVPLKVGNKYYSMRYGNVGHVSYKNMIRAWSLSPCQREGMETITIYTDTENVSTGTWPLNISTGISEVGEGTYSITGNNGGTYYRH